MMNIKKYLGVLCSVLVLWGCTKPDTQEAHSVAQDTKPVVVTTFTILADMTQNIAGDAAHVVSITKAGAEIHHYEPTPKDIAKIQQADLIVHNGLGLERWFMQFYAHSPNVPSVIASEGITPIMIADGAYINQPNPHAWMSPNYALIYVDNIKKALIAIDPANENTYTQNAAAYSEKIRALDAPLREQLSKIAPNQRYLVTSEGAFGYWAQDYDFQEAYLWPINADQQGTPKQVKALIDTVRAQKIPVVFSESTVSDKPMRQVAQETNAQYGGVLYVDSLSLPDEKVPTYLDLLFVTTKTIADGFLNAQQQ